MIEEFECEGHWWLPEKPEQKIEGTLKFAPTKGISLHLIGLFGGFEETSKTTKLDIVLGFSTDGRRISLCDSIISRWTIHQPGMSECWLEVSYVLIGEHFQKKDQIKFKSMWVRFSHLDEWLNISGFKIDHLKKGGVTIRYRLPKNLSFKVSPDLQMRISFGVKYPTFSIAQKEASIKQESWLGIIPLEPESLEGFLPMIHHLRNFVTLATMKPVYPISVNGKMESNGERECSVDMFYSLGEIIESSVALGPTDMLFAFKDISTQLRFLLRNWFKKAELLEPVFDLYFGTLYMSRIYVTTEFLNFAQGLESYHRRTMKGYELPKVEHRERIRKILKCAPKEHGKWLREKLNYGNELTLKKRLEGLLESIPRSLESTIPDKEDFIRKTVDTRNYLTHYDRKLKEKAARNEELFKLTLKLNILLQFHLLKELGFEPGKIENMISHLTSRFSILREVVQPQKVQSDIVKKQQS
jgi:hypothetical protein